MGLISLSIAVLIFFHAIAMYPFSFLRSTLIHFLSIPVDGHLTCLHIWAIMNNAGINIHIKIFVWIYASISLGEIPKRGTVGSYVRCLNF